VNEHVLYGAMVGGPLSNDRFWDWRDDWVQAEIALDYNAMIPTLAAMQVSRLYADQGLDTDSAADEQCFRSILRPSTGGRVLDSIRTTLRRRLALQRRAVWRRDRRYRYRHGSRSCPYLWVHLLGVQEEKVLFQIGSDGSLERNINWDTRRGKTPLYIIIRQSSI